jgi:hypothetical protein
VTVAGEGVVPGVQEGMAAHALVIAVWARSLSAKALRQVVWVPLQHSSCAETGRAAKEVRPAARRRRNGVRSIVELRGESSL